MDEKSNFYSSMSLRFTYACMLAGHVGFMMLIVGRKIHVSSYLTRYCLLDMIPRFSLGCRVHDFDDLETLRCGFSISGGT